MNNIIMRKITVTGSYQPLVSGKLIGSVTISALPTNTGNVLFKGDDGLDVPWLPGEWHQFKSVDLGSIQIKGTGGDVVSVVGGTW
jgi:hypothetical protein